jgi:hypothetical protein
MFYRYLLRAWMFILAVSLLLGVGKIVHATSLQNPGFEDGLNHWTIPSAFADQISIETAIFHTGKQSLKIDTMAKQNSPFAVCTINEVVPGANYRFSVWARVAPDSPAIGGMVKYELYNAKGVNTAGEYSGTQLPSNGEWREISIEFEPAEDTTSIRFYLRLFGKSKVLFDDALVEIPAVSVSGPQKTAVEISTPTNLSYQFRFRDAWPKIELPQIYAELARIDSTEPQKITAQVKKINERNFNVELPVPALASGDYSIQFFHLDVGKELRINTDSFIFTKLPSRKPEFLSDAGTLLHNGAPFFPIGMYHPTVSDYELLANNGFNAVQGGASQAELDTAQKHGIAIDVVLYGGMRAAENLNSSLAQIKQFAGHPAVLCWKMMDEPDVNGSVGNEVPDVYRTLKATGVKQPIELTLGPETLGAGKNLNFWTNFSDIIQLDRYPVPGNPLTWVSDFTREAVSYKQPWQNLQYVLQSGWKKDLSNQPSVPQARSMAYLALIEGAKGIWWYSMREGDGWDLTKTPLWPRMKEINTEIKTLSEPLMLGKVIAGVSCDQPGVFFRAIEHQGKTFLLVTNPQDMPIQATFTLPDHLRSYHLLNSDAKQKLDKRKLVVDLTGVDSRTFVLEK